MILYHGSNIAIDIIDLSKSKPNKDFGKAFYLSEHEQQAEEMAAFAVERFGGKPVVTTFEFDETWLNNVKGITFQYAFCTELAISKLIRI